MPMRCRANRRGAALVEFAFVLPLFLMFLFGLLEIGRGMMTVSLMTGAARAGCRTGVLPSATNDTVKETVTKKTTGMGISTPTIKIFVNGKEGDVATAQPRDEITVSATVAWADVTWLPFTRWFGGNLSGHFSLPHE
jgi:Flp pilus assembly protein TadG